MAGRSDPPASLRITDLHQPDVLSIITIPVPSAPERAAHEDTKAPEKPSAATLDAVIKLLRGADVSSL